MGHRVGSTAPRCLSFLIVRVRWVLKLLHGVKRDKVNLDIFWLRDESVEDSSSLPAPDVLADEIVEDLRSALEQFEEIGADLKSSHP